MRVCMQELFKKQDGFTILELVVVIVAVAILVVIAFSLGN
jgi:prepilin-type N-terminal cleavage/methylation domain-containing protein